MNAFGISETGLIRTNNEDSFYISDDVFFGLPNLYIVADGMGGHKSGEVASIKSIEFFIEYCKNNLPENGEILDFLISAASFSNRKVFELSHSDESFEGMGTTFSACVLERAKLYIAHIGDSRIYSVSENEIKQLTTDHTYVNEMVKVGQITSEQAKSHPSRNMLTRVLGPDADAVIDGYVCDLTDDMKIILCSDGLTNMVNDDRILDICLSNKDNNAEAARLMVNTAMENGGIDNCTVIIMDSWR